MKKIPINCDLGEGLHNEEQLMPYLTYCNIACGGHAGDEKTMNFVVELAKKFKVHIGAHPSYQDVENFGRKSLEIKNVQQFIKSIRNQINSLLQICKNFNVPMYHIKPHGALYNDIAKDAYKAELFLKAIEKYPNCYLFVPYNSEVENLAKAKKINIIYEAFADRNYNSDLSLVSRNNENAIIKEPMKIKKHVLEMMQSNYVTAISGEKLYIKADTFCVHSDTSNAVKIVREINL